MEWEEVGVFVPVIVNYTTSLLVDVGDCDGVGELVWVKVVEGLVVGVEEGVSVLVGVGVEGFY